MPSSSSIPLINLNAFYATERNANDMQSLLQQVDSALRDTGFLCINGTQLTTEYIKDSQAVAQQFFDLPLGDRMKSEAIRYKTRGYTGMGAQGLSYAMDADDIKQNVTQPSDLFERYRVGPIDDFESMGESAKLFLETAYAPNIWPSNEVPEFEPSMRKYYQSMNQLARDLLKIFALILQLPETWFEDKVNQSMSSLAINHYPPQHTPPLPGQLRAGAHTGLLLCFYFLISILTLLYFIPPLFQFCLSTQYISYNNSLCLSFSLFVYFLLTNSLFFSLFLSVIFIFLSFLSFAQILAHSPSLLLREKMRVGYN